MRTRKPLDMDANTVFASVEMNSNSLADDEGLGATGMYSWKNEQETVGILVTASTLETIGRARKAENYWEEGWSASGVAGGSLLFSYTQRFTQTVFQGWPMMGYMTNRLLRRC